MYPGAHAETSPQQPAVIMSGSGETLTYAELEDRSLRLARLLAERGLRRGDRVALLSENSPRYSEVYWAALRSGLYLTAINHHLKRAEINYILNDCGAKALIVSVARSAQALEVLEDTPAVRSRFVFGGVLDAHDRKRLPVG